MSDRISRDARFTPSDFEAVLMLAPEGCPLVSGQAVAWWAERYAIYVDGKFGPVTSQDIDFWGSREDLLELAKRLKRRPHFPHQYEMTVWVGAIPLEIAGKRTVAEFLHTIPGLDTNNADLASVEQRLELGGRARTIQVLTPVSLVWRSSTRFVILHRLSGMTSCICASALKRAGSFSKNS